MAQTPGERIDKIYMDDLLSRVPLTSVVGRHVKLERTGSGMQGCCPFHTESTPSFKVYEKTKHYHCFGCGEHGDAVKFVQRITGQGFREVVRQLAQEVGMESPKGVSTSETAEGRAERERVLAERQKRMEAERAAYLAEQGKRENAIAKLAERNWSRGKPASPDHPYLVSKKVGPHDLREDGKGRLLLPLRDEHGKLWNLQTISEEGHKITLWRKVGEETEGGRMRGLYAILGDVQPGGPLVIAEGFSTAATIRQETGLPVAIAVSSGNLEAVTKILHEKHPDSRIVIAADNDHHKPRLDPPKENVGLKAGEVAAAVVGGTLALPQFSATDKGTDWNDYRAQHGEGSVRREFDRILAAPVAEIFPEPKTGPMPENTPTLSETPAVKQIGNVPELLQAIALASRHAVGEDDHPIRRALEQLIDRHENVANAASGQNADFRTDVAYLVQDTERRLGVKFQLTPELREDMTKLAGQYPGLVDERVLPLLQQTSNLGSPHQGLVNELRRTARDLVHGSPSDEIDDRIAVLEHQIRDAIGGGVSPTLTLSTPLAPPPQEAAPQPGAASPETPTNSAPKPETPTPDPAQATPKQAPPAQERPPAQPTGPTSIQAGQVHIKQGMAAILEAMRRPAPVTQPPWQQGTEPLQGKVAAFEQRHDEQGTSQLVDTAQRAAQAASAALSRLETTQGAGILNKIKEAAKNDPNGIQGVMSEMRPGGKYEDLRTAFNGAMTQERAFAAAFDRTARAAGEYGLARSAVSQDFLRRGLNTADLEKQFAKVDQEISEATSRIPGRQDGKSMQQELAEKAAEFFRQVVEKVKAAFSPSSPSAAPSQSPSLQPAMAP